MIKKIIIVSIILFSLFLVYNLTQQIANAMKAGNRLDKSAEELAQLQKKNRELKDKLSQVQTVGFVEEQARDKLNLARPGETVVVIDSKQIDSILRAGQKPIESNQPYWQGWLKLFI